MLRITVNKSASAAKKYYSEMYYSEGHDLQSYYADKDQSIGTWHGKAADRLNLIGNIDKNDFASLCDNHIPGTDEQLTERNNIERRVGYDFTFNTSKSVTLAYTFANEDDKKQILQAFRDSVKDAMDEVEKGIQTRIRKSGMNENRETGNIVYGEFVHFTSRPIDNVPDPHLHAHCFVFNATFDEVENKWKAAQFGQVKQDAPYYEAVFQSSLAKRLNNLGYETERTNNGFELKGIDRETIEKFSRRTQEIDNIAKTNNITDKSEKAEIGAKSRESKRNSISEDQQIEIWKGRLTETEQQKFDSLKKSGFADEKKKEDFENVRNSAKDAVNYSLDHHFERKSVTTDKEILATAIKTSLGETTAAEIRKAFDKKENVISVKQDNKIYITTKEALSEENTLIAKAYDMKGKFKTINEDYRPDETKVNDEQFNAIRHALQSTDGITIIAGKAGTGKTTLMKEVQNGVNDSGKQLFAFAPSAEASRMVQRKEGFENADTVASLIKSKVMQEKIKGSVIWIDEAGLLSNKDMNRVIDVAQKQNARIILTGDIKQHNSVERGDALRTLQQEAGIISIQVNKIQRQKDESYRSAVKSLSKADVEKGFKKLDNMGAIHEFNNSNERISAIADDYYSSAYKKMRKGKKENEVLVVSPTHAEGEKVTEKIRDKLKEQKILSVDDKTYMIFKNMQLTEAQKAKAETYDSDKWLIFHQNCKGFKAGSKYHVIGADEKKNIMMKDMTGKEASISLDKAENYNLFEARQIEVAKGDKIRITGNGYANDGKRIFNGNLYNINGFDKEGNIKLSNGSTISKDYGHFTWGYVVTSHASQGKTVDKVILSQSSMSFRASSQEQFYVSVSRGRQAVSIYTDDKEELMQAVSRSSERQSAINLTREKKIMNDVIEINRNNSLKRKKESALMAVDKLRQSFNKIVNYEQLQRTDRTKKSGKER